MKLYRVFMIFKHQASYRTFEPTGLIGNKRSCVYCLKSQGFVYNKSKRMWTNETTHARIEVENA